MIFVTIGTQAPFDRFIEIVDNLASMIDEEVIVQNSDKSIYKIKNATSVGFISPDKFNEIFNSARLIIAHAGMGTILSAMQNNKPIIIFPRLASLKEHRNDHQMATAKQMEKLGYVYVAYTADQLKDLFFNNNLKPKHSLGPYASKSLINGLQDLIDG